MAIDTSCDDTCVAILKIVPTLSSSALNRESSISNQETLDEIGENCKLKILSNVVSSQVKLHQKYGGVYPTLAKREHRCNLAPVLKESLLKARLLKSKIKNKKLKTQIRNKKIKKFLVRENILYKRLKEFLEKYQKPEIDAIAVTVGPGLEPCLWQGVNFAKALCFWWDLPVIPVNHIEAHLFANWLRPISSKLKIKNKKLKTQIKNEEIKFPAVCLVVSGGHTQLILMTPIRKTSFSNGTRKNWKYKIIGETRDDAAGECFDKTARILGLPYPGGPAIAQQAGQLKSKVKNQKSKIILPRPMINSKDYDLSFSGLKTAVLYDFRKRPEKVRTSKEYIREMAKEIQQAIIDVLIKKTIRAAKNYKAKTIILGGGVVANQEFRKQLGTIIKKQLPNTYYLKPKTCFCTDNAAMVALAGYFNKNKKKNWKEIKANANLRM
ncbi:MAG: tRNA (adenosine(37)-N6)-threonylcarbamoyltransferase complex transferase subunit TsaD [Patescibacteria group bacterium]|nr:tRNA (adenosine(37)-N6)-threonylcarbamoyltransferase complex transferase subunit TsaD [Patescibacteria group bacterium]